MGRRKSVFNRVFNRDEVRRPYEEGMSIREIAVRMDLRVGTVHPLEQAA
jgi:DNA-directed RNA polymerase specialized sigma24 family protein